jgi:phospholipid/cholesterol/gamma-HCH transport system substrate-binding protein
MKDQARVEIAVGLFVLLGAAALVYLSVSIGGTVLWPSDRYPLHARFATVGDLSQGAVVKLAGVPVGEVTAVRLDDYAARVELRVDRALKLPKDTIASIKTAGLLGEAYVSLSPGAADHDLAEGDAIAQTEAPLDLFDLIGKYAFESKDSAAQPSDRPAGGSAAEPWE